MPPPAPTAMPPTVASGAAAVYLPACVNRIFGRAAAADGGDDPASLPAALVAVSLRAGRPLWIPPDVAGTCCAHPWTSKGYGEAAALDGQRDRRGALALERRRASSPS